VIVYILRAARNLRSIGWAITLGLLLGGATGNLLDRIFRAPGAFQGHVVDWIELPHWPVFNLADSSIVCAGVLVVLLALFGVRLDGTRSLQEANSSQPNSSQPASTDPAPSTPAPSTPAPSTSAPSIPAPSIPAPSIPAPSIPASSPPDSPNRDNPKLEYPDPQIAVPGRADSADHPAEDGR
jgi:signal peptidase II